MIIIKPVLSDQKKKNSFYRRKKLFYIFKVKILNTLLCWMLFIWFFVCIYLAVWIHSTHYTALWFSTFVFTLLVNNDFNLKSCLSLFCQLSIPIEMGAWAQDTSSSAFTLFVLCMHKRKTKRRKTKARHSLEKWKWNVLNFFLFISTRT